MSKRLHFLQPVCFVIICLLSKVQVADGQVADTLSYCSTGCCSVDHTPAGIMISHMHPRGGWMFSYRYMGMAMRNNQVGTTGVSDEQVYQNYLMSPQYMRMDMHMLMVMYGLSDKITLMAMLNYNVLSMNMSMMAGGMMNMPGMDMGNMGTDMVSHTSGIGDTKLYALYSIYSKGNHQLVASGGISVPTGDIHISGTSENMYPGKRIPYGMQLGSGSFEALPGVTYLRYTNTFSFSIQATSVIRTNYNSVGYKLGNELTLTTWASYQWNRWFSNSLRVEGSAAGKITGFDPTLYYGMEPSANPGNYGGQRLNIYGGLNFYIRSGILRNNRLAIEYGIPLYQNLNGLQTAIQSTLYAAWQIAF